MNQPQLMPLLREANMAIRGAFRDTFTDLDVTPQQVTVLHLVNATPGSSSAELARRSHVKPQTMHKLVSDLERRGLLSLQPRPGHGRILDANLTDEGQALLAAADTRARAIEDRMTAGLGEQQRDQLFDLLQQCVDALGPPSDDAGS